MARHFIDPRYLRIDDRPLFIIYNPSNRPEAAKAIGRWGRLLRKRHKRDPLMLMAQTFGAVDPGVFGLDGTIELPPHKLSDDLPGRNPSDACSADFGGRVIDYQVFMVSSLAQRNPAYPLVKTVVSTWDAESGETGELSNGTFEENRAALTPHARHFAAANVILTSN